jgi:hypothetical protein
LFSDIGVALTIRTVRNGTLFENRFPFGTVLDDFSL